MYCGLKIELTEKNKRYYKNLKFCSNKCSGKISAITNKKNNTSAFFDKKIQSKGGKIGGKISWKKTYEINKKNKWGFFDSKVQSRSGKKGIESQRKNKIGLFNPIIRKKSHEINKKNKTGVWSKDVQIKGGKVMTTKYGGWAFVTKEQRSENGKKFGKLHKGIPKSKITKQKMRISAIEYIKNNSNFTTPRTGRYEKQILDEFQNTLGFSIKRQFYINGYFLDGYCQELNLAIEVDEGYHYQNNILNQKDIEKQNSIIKILNCDFIRLKVLEIIIDNKINKEKLRGFIKEYE